MKLALLSADIENPMPNLGDFFITEGIMAALGDHEYVRLPMHQVPNQGDILEAQSSDALILCGTNILGAAGTLRLSWDLPTLEKIGRPVIPLGLGAQADRGCRPLLDLRGRELLHFLYRSGGKIAVRDRLTFEAVEKELGQGTAKLLGCPAQFYEATREKPTGCGPTLFCPPPFHYEPPGVRRRDYLRLPMQLFHHLPQAVFLAQQPSDFGFAGVPCGMRTVHSPEMPAWHGTLLAASRLVVSFRIHPALVAASHGVPSCVVAVDARTRALAEMYAIPVVDAFSEPNAKLLAEKIQLLTSSIDQSVIDDKFAFWRDSFSREVAVRGLVRPKKVRVEQSPPLFMTAVASQEYFSHLIGWVDNLRAVHPGVHFHILTLDKQIAKKCRQTFKESEVGITELTELGNKSFLERLKGEPIRLQAYRVKSAWLWHLARASSRPWIFSDLDVYFFQSPQKLANLSPEAHTLLFPHWGSPEEIRRRHGKFNAGMMVISPGSVPFLKWWMEKCFEQCVEDPERGLFFEQGYLNHGPLAFFGVQICRDEGQNAGTWAFPALQPKISSRQFHEVKIRDGGVLSSWHTAQPDPEGVLSFKTVRDQISMLLLGEQSPQAERFLRFLFYHQARFSSEVRRVMFLFHTLTLRWGWSVRLSPAFMDFAVSGKLRAPLWLFSRLYSMGRDMWRAAKRLFGKRMDEYVPGRWLSGFASD